jgi:hypothetical protein
VGALVPGTVAAVLPLAAPTGPLAATAHGIALGGPAEATVEATGLEEEHPPAANAVAKLVASKPSFPLVFMISLRTQKSCPVRSPTLRRFCVPT